MLIDCKSNKLIYLLISNSTIFGFHQLATRQSDHSIQQGQPTHSLAACSVAIMHTLNKTTNNNRIPYRTKYLFFYPGIDSRVSFIYMSVRCSSNCAKTSVQSSIFDSANIYGFVWSVGLLVRLTLSNQIEFECLSLML